MHPRLLLFIYLAMFDMLPVLYINFFLIKMYLGLFLNGERIVAYSGQVGKGKVLAHLSGLKFFPLSR